MINNLLVITAASKTLTAYFLVMSHNAQVVCLNIMKHMRYMVIIRMKQKTFDDSNYSTPLHYRKQVDLVVVVFFS